MQCRGEDYAHFLFHTRGGDRCPGRVWAKGMPQVIQIMWQVSEPMAGECPNVSENCGCDQITSANCKGPQTHGQTQQGLDLNHQVYSPAAILACLQDIWCR